MKKARIGFVPAHREPFDEGWAVRMRQRCLDALGSVPGVEVIAPDAQLTANGLIRDDDDVNKVIELFKQKGIDGLIIGTMTFGDEVSALTVASAFNRIPLLLFGTKEGPFKPDGGRRSDSFCGTLSVSSGLVRRGMPFLFTGIVFPEELAFTESIANFARVCYIAKGFLGARIGMIGPRPERFETCISNEDAMMRQFGQSVVPTSLLDIMQKLESLKGKDTQLQRIIREMGRETDLSAIQPDVVKNIAGLQLAIRQFAQEKCLSAVAAQCWTALQETYGISACYAFGRLSDAGVLTACEVDVYGALTMLVQYLAAMKKTPPHFIDWTIRHQNRENVFLAWHCGNAPPSLVCKGCSISLRNHSILSAQLGSENTCGAAEFPIRQGVVTLNRLIEIDGKFKMLITSGVVEKPEQKLRGSWSWVRVEDLDTLYRTLVHEGFTHHASMIHGNYAQAIEDACLFLGMDIVVV